MSNQIAATFSTKVFGDGISSIVVIDLKNNPIYVNDSHDSLFNQFNLSNHLPIGVVANQFVVANQTPKSVILSGDHSTITITLNSSFTGFASAQGMILF